MIINFKLPDNNCETVYLSKVVEHLKEKDLSDDFNLVVTEFVDSNIIFPENKRTILILTGDERYQIPNCLDQAFLVFKNYVKEEYKNLIPLPLGYNKSLLEIPFISIQDRTIDVFFSGQVNIPNRFSLFNFLNENFHDLNKHVNRTPAFRKGYDATTYSNYLMNTKIAFVPDGCICSESFRFFEASKYGCVLITMPKPSNWVYNGFCGFIVNSWEESLEIVYSLMLDEDLLKSCSKNSLEYWKKYCSEESVANFIIERIQYETNIR